MHDKHAALTKHFSRVSHQKTKVDIFGKISGHDAIKVPAQTGLTTEMRPFHKHDKAEPIEPGAVHKLRIELLPMSVLVRRGACLRLEITNWESAITEAPMIHWYGQKVGSDTYYHNAANPSHMRLHERPRRTETVGH